MTKTLLILFLSAVCFAQNARMLSGVNAQTGVSYTFVPADATRLTTFQNAAAVAVTLPNGATAGFGVGYEFDAQNLGAGTVTITCTSCLIFSNGAGGSGTLAVTAGEGIELFGAGVNYYAILATSSPFAITVGPGMSLQTAINMLPASGGTVYIEPGTYAGPTCPGSNVSLISLAPPANVWVGGSLTGNVVQSQVTLQYTSSLTCTDTQNMQWKGIGLDFQTNAAGLVLSGVKLSTFDGLSIVRCGSTSVACLSLQPDSITPLNNERNRFVSLAIGGNVAGYLGVQLIGTGTVNAGPSVTDNDFEYYFCTGNNITYCVDFEKNSDTNHFHHIDANCASGTCTAPIAFNTSIPGSDIDADAEKIDGVSATGNWTNVLAAGASTGNVLDVWSASGLTGPSINVLGGTPSYCFTTIGFYLTQSAFLCPYIEASQAIVAVGPKAALTGTGACTTGSLSLQIGGAWAGSVACGGTTGASTLVISPGTTVPSAWECRGEDTTSGHELLGVQSGQSTTTCTLKFSSVTSADHVTFVLTAF